MNLETIKDQLPDYARDIRLNLGSITTIASLNAQQLWGCAVAAAAACRNPALYQAVLAEAAPHLSPEALQAAKIAASLMAMNNIYYRFTHLVGNAQYRSMPARLRMTALGNPGVDKLDFELWSLAVSAINGCGMCIESHEHEVLAKGATADMVQDAVRIAAILHAAAVTLEMEQAAGSPLAAAA